MRASHVAAALAAPALLAACAAVAGIDPFTTSDAGHDAGHDVTIPHDARVDAGRDSGVDAGHDTGLDVTETVVVPYDSALPVGPIEGGVISDTAAIHTFAIRRLYIGDTSATAAFTASASAWQTIGYDLDGLDTTTANATNTCTPATPGAGVIDGLNGIDNAFGGVIVGRLAGDLKIAVDEGLHEADASTPVSQVLSEEIGQGQFTALLNTHGIQGGETMQSAVGLTGGIFVGGAYGGSGPATYPLGDSGTEFLIDASWPVNRSSLVPGGGVEDAAAVQFPSAYITNDVWVSGSLSSTPTLTIPLTILIDGHALTFTVHHAVITFVYSPTDAGQGLALHGVLAGVLDTTELLEHLATTLGPVAGGQFCGVLRTTFEPDLLAAQDMILGPDDAISNKPGVACNAISVGLGFDADEIQIPTKVAADFDAGDAAPCPLDSGS